MWFNVVSLFDRPRIVLLVYSRLLTIFVGNQSRAKNCCLTTLLQHYFFKNVATFLLEYYIFPAREVFFFCNTLYPRVNHHCGIFILNIEKDRASHIPLRFN
jgi:hypothetical protein